MRRRRFVLAAGLPAAFAALGLFVNAIGPVSLLLVVLGLCALVIISLVLVVLLALRAAKVRERAGSVAAFRIPALGVVTGALGLAAGYVGGPPALPRAGLTPADELAYIHNTDQGDRITLRLLRPERDAARVRRVLELHEQGLVTGSIDRLNAAWVLQHGDDSTHYRLAHELAKAAFEGWVETRHRSKREAEWLMKAAYDRWMLSIGKPQVHGTQTELELGF